MNTQKKGELDRYMTVDDWKKFKAAITDSREALLWTLIVSCGLRLQEALQLTPEDFDFKAGLVRIATLKRKGHPVFAVDVPPELCESLRSMRLKKGERFFKMSSSWAWRKFKRVVRRAKLNSRYSPHALRHLYGILLSEETKGDLVKVSRGLRHAKPDTANRYVHVAPKLRRELANKAWEKL